jgi:hypothetical protein
MELCPPAARVVQPWLGFSFLGDHRFRLPCLLACRLRARVELSLAADRIPLEELFAASPGRTVSRGWFAGAGGIVMNAQPEPACCERRTAWGVLLGLAFVKFALHVATHHRYGYFRDELYYLACGKHLAWGYVDHPPLVPLIAHLNHLLLGDSLFAMRLLPILAMCAVVVLTGWMAGALGGGRYAQALAALTIVLSPAYLVMGTFLSVNPFDILWWTICLAMVIGLLNGANPRLWLAVGLVAGIGLLTKYTIVFLGLGLGCALVLTPARRQLAGKWPWLGLAVALAVVTPHVIWQWRHGWPTAEFFANIRAHKNYPVSPLEFVAMQFAVVHPFIFPVWVIGLSHCLFARSARPYRLPALVYLIVFMTFMVLRAKFYYLFPAYPAPLAAGGVAMERYLTARGARRAKVLVFSLLVGGGIATMPYALPVLPFDTFRAYDRMLRINRELRFEQGREKSQAIIYADMLGWPELVERVAAVVGTLDTDAQANCVVLAANYGEAGAVDLFGGPLGLPHAVCPHNSYHMWGPGERPWETVVAIGFTHEKLKAWFADVALREVVRHPGARESEVNIHVCRNLTAPVEAIWPSLKTYR